MWVKIFLGLMMMTLLGAGSLQDRHTLYIIGDSTVRNGRGKGDNGLWGWGDFMAQHFDTMRMAVRNYALGGRSSRTFMTEGHWDEVLGQLKKGDYVLLQFGHNDGGPLDDTARARGTIKGIGEETKDIYNPVMKKNETVHTYGWYMRKYVNDIKAKGAVAILCSPIPRNIWKEGKVERDSADYGGWAKETARMTGAYFIPLNDLVAMHYERLGSDSVSHFFPGDHTHTNEAGARLNESEVIRGMLGLQDKGLMIGFDLRAQGPVGGDPRIDREGRIDRQALVTRHDVVNEDADSLSALSLGNGHFAFTVDVTGLQSFPDYYSKGVPLGTESEWGWHSFIDTAGYRREEAMQEYAIHGRKVGYLVQPKGHSRQQAAADWYRQNPHRLQLGCLGFELRKRDGGKAGIEDIHDIRQELELWRGRVRSSFVFEGVPVSVITVVDPREDRVAVSVQSVLLREGRLKIRLRLPYPTGAFSDAGNDWGHSERHWSAITHPWGDSGVRIEHRLDSTHYFLDLAWSGKAGCRPRGAHEYVVEAIDGDVLDFSCGFSERGMASEGWAFERVMAAADSAWRAFWESGAAMDLSESRDPWAFELERRVVLSQYLTRIQEAGEMPPQETGLTYNSWYGKPHLEMHWWHAAHFALWGRPELLERSLAWYGRGASVARAIAARQGYAGLRWQKMTDPAGEESPSSVGAFLIWQQPHFIYMAELCYRAHGDVAVLQRYKDLVFATADFMASYAWWDPVRKKYILGNGLIPAQERFAAGKTVNPGFELAYWRWALGMAQEWRRRLGMEEDSSWRKVERGLADLPVMGGLYLPTESEPDAYTNVRYRGDHPAVLGAYGFLPAIPGMDTAMMGRTFDWVWANWNWASTWGWDFPLMAMTATRLGRPGQAIDALLMPVGKNRYLKNGHNYQDERLRLYLPGNGGLLAAVAMMCAGYDGCGEREPGFPKDGSWVVKWEGFKRMP